MKTITFDGSKTFIVNREENGQVNIRVCENDIGMKCGEIREMQSSDLSNGECLVKLELPKEISYINMCRVLLSFATSSELMQIIGSPLTWCAYMVKQPTRGLIKGEKIGKRGKR